MSQTAHPFKKYLIVITFHSTVELSLLLIFKEHIKAKILPINISKLKIELTNIKTKSRVSGFSFTVPRENSIIKRK